MPACARLKQESITLKTPVPKGLNSLKRYIGTKKTEEQLFTQHHTPQ
jgi:hypothetical protein